jgi:hypothetical protein
MKLNIFKRNIIKLKITEQEEGWIFHFVNQYGWLIRLPKKIRSFEFMDFLMALDRINKTTSTNSLIKATSKRGCLVPRQAFELEDAKKLIEEGLKELGYKKVIFKKVKIQK